MSREYIVALSRAYEQFFATYQGARLLVIDTDRLNVVGNPADLQAVCARIRAALANGPLEGALAPAELGPAAGHASPAVAAAPSAGSEPPASLYAEFLALQQAVGELAGALLRTATGQPGPASESEREHAAQALAACESSLQHLAARVRALR